MAHRALEHLLQYGDPAVRYASLPSLPLLRTACPLHAGSRRVFTAMPVVPPSAVLRPGPRSPTHHHCLPFASPCCAGALSRWRSLTHHHCPASRLLRPAVQAVCPAGDRAAQRQQPGHGCDGHAEPAEPRHRRVRMLGARLVHAAAAVVAVLKALGACSEATARPVLLQNAPPAWWQGRGSDSFCCCAPPRARGHRQCRARRIALPWLPPRPLPADTDVAMNAVLALGFIGAGTNNAR